jgi:hypothetical protein
MILFCPLAVTEMANYPGGCKGPRRRHLPITRVERGREHSLAPSP